MFPLCKRLSTQLLLSCFNRTRLICFFLNSFGGFADPLCYVHRETAQQKVQIFFILPSVFSEIYSSPQFCFPGKFTPLLSESPLALCRQEFFTLPPESCLFILAHSVKVTTSGLFLGFFLLNNEKILPLCCCV